MAYRDDLEALAARRDAIAGELTAARRARDTVARALEDKRRLPVLADVRVASPCASAWDAMTGGDRVRSCSACKQDVYNLSGMTRAEAEALVIARRGDLRVRFYMRTDGTVLLRDCAIGRRRGTVKAVAAAAIGLAVGLGVVQTLRARDASRDEAAPDLERMHHVIGKYEGVLVLPPGHPRVGDLPFVERGRDSDRFE